MRSTTAPTIESAPSISLSTLQWFLVLRMLFASVAKGQNEIAARLRLFRWLTSRAASGWTGAVDGEVYFRELLRDGLSESVWNVPLSVALPADALPLLTLLENALERWLESGEGFQTGAQQWAVLELLEKLRGSLSLHEVKPS